MAHTITVSDEIWSWAVDNVNGDGPATFLRNILIKEAMRNPGRRPPLQQREMFPASGGRGKGVHMACYEKMVDERGDADIPSASVIESRFSTICPKCKKVINPVEQIVMTNIEEW